jgi:hypothetical protein
MCTVSFIPNSRGFSLAMNRDELLTRPTALPPRVFESNGCRSVFPREPTGGTWIVVNDAGVWLTLLNWHRFDRLPVGEIVSRGQVPKALAESDSIREITIKLNRLSLNRIRPFRLIACEPGEKQLVEYGWDLEQLRVQKHDWKPNHWFSSGHDEKQAEYQRAQICQAASHQPSVGTLDWLRDLHRSHLPERGPFSICMHQPVAETVSYTEVSVSDRVAVMRYQPGSPCAGGKIYESTLALSRYEAGQPQIRGQRSGRGVDDPP